MGRYFYSEAHIKSPWYQVLAAFWQRYPNPFSAHVLTEDVLYREVTATNLLLSRRLLTKTNRLPGWAEHIFPAHMTRAVYILEDSIVDPEANTLVTKTWNLNHNTLMVRPVSIEGSCLRELVLIWSNMSGSQTVVERCMFEQDTSQPTWTTLKREAWISSSVYGLARPIQEFGVARYKSNQTQAMKGLDYALTKIQSEELLHLHGDQDDKPRPPKTPPTPTKKPNQFA